MQNSDEWLKAIGSKGLGELLRFQLQMVTRRVSMGWTARELRKAIIDQGYKFNPETGSLVWKMADVQEWCRILGGKLVVTFPGVPEPDMEMFSLLAQAMSSVLDENAVDRFRAVRFLAMARVTMGASTKEFAKKINMTPEGVSSWEAGTENPLIPGLFRHAFGLDGTARLDFVETEPVKGPKGR